METLARKVICALDTPNLDEALTTVTRLSSKVGAFKIGHGLTLPNGLDVIDRLQDAGAERIFLDLKFHDIPNSVALGVREAAKRRVWMLTLHIAGGPAMMTAAAEEARAYSAEKAPLLMGVSVLTSLDDHMLRSYLGVERSVEEHMLELSKLACDFGLDGVISSAHEVKAIREAIGHQGVIVTPGIRIPSGEQHDQKRVGTATQALADGADYLVIGRALSDSPDPDAVLDQLGLMATA
ncbi:MAG: orotidine-5-phosphate decarboxylase [Fimbriimonadaceae bacterium]|jgi:orotidine-5'-phosphate decarboxylase|nr:orotidine-5-phosphate decarboxylase [Fimbriimonadaceae bacterium]